MRGVSARAALAPTHYAKAMDWTEILKAGQIEEPPGYQETLAAIKAEPYVKPKKKAKKR